MKIVREIAAHSKRDVILINHNHVIENLQKIANLLSKSVEKRYFLTLNREQIEDFWHDVSNKIQTSYIDCLHLRCY